MSEGLTVVSKVGGASMTDPGRVAESLQARTAYDGYPRDFVIVSALGIGNGDTTKVTDELYMLAEANVIGKPRVVKRLQEQIIERHRTRFSSLGSKDSGTLTGKLVAGFQNFPEDPEMQPAYFASLGEEASACGFALLTGGIFQDSPIRFGRSGNVWRQRTIQGIASNYRHGKLPTDKTIVYPGYYGYGPNGQRFVLDRGGSDRTGAIVSRGLARYLGDKSVIYDNLTDRPIYSADWRYVKGVVPLRELSRRLIREGAHGGNPVLQGDTIVDLNGSEIVTYVKSTFDINDPGTRVVPTHMLDDDAYSGTSERPVVAISGRNLVEIFIDDLGMANQHRYLARLLGRAASHGLSVEHVPASQDYVTITLHEKAEIERVMAFEESVRRIAGGHAKVTHQSKGVIYLVGEHLRDSLVKTRTLGRVCTIAAEAGYGLNDVSDEQSPSIALLVQPDAVDPLQQLLHDELIAAELYIESA